MCGVVEQTCVPCFECFRYEIKSKFIGASGLPKQAIGSALRIELWSKLNLARTFILKWSPETESPPFEDYSFFEIGFRSLQKALSKAPTLKESLKPDKRKCSLGVFCESALLIFVTKDITGNNRAIASMMHKRGAFVFILRFNHSIMGNVCFQIRS